MFYDPTPLVPFHNSCTHSLLPVASFQLFFVITAPVILSSLLQSFLCFSHSCRYFPVNTPVILLVTSLSCSSFRLVPVLFAVQSFSLPFSHSSGCSFTRSFHRCCSHFTCRSSFSYFSSASLFLCSVLFFSLIVD